MLISRFYQEKELVVSYEIFPPKKTDDISKIYATVRELKEIKPDFLSVTYGAGGTTRDTTVEIVSTIKKEFNIETMAHLTCVNSTINEINEILNELAGKNIKNILALRGDPPAGQSNYTQKIGGFNDATELTRFISRHNNWCIAVAGYPEGHSEAASLEQDVEFLKVKVDQGAHFVISQLFFDNQYFYRFMDLCVQKNITVPIVPGIFPILNFSSIKKIVALCGAKIPKTLYNKLEQYSDKKEDLEKYGIEYAVKQVEELLDFGIPGVHFYTMNKSKQLKTIYNALRNKLKKNV